MTAIGLVGDIGATNSRLALVEPDGSFSQIRVFAADEFAGLAEIIETYFSSKARTQIPPRAVLAVASPMTGDEISFTNLPWTFSIEDLRRRFGFAHLSVINDFVANALALPHLGPDATRERMPPVDTTVWKRPLPAERLRTRTWSIGRTGCL